MKYTLVVKDTEMRSWVKFFLRVFKKLCKLNLVSQLLKYYFLTILNDNCYVCQNYGNFVFCEFCSFY